MIFWVLSVMTWLVVAAGLFGVTVAGWYVWGRWREDHPRPGGGVDDGADRVPSCWMCACGSRFQTFEKGQEHVELFHRLPADIMLTGVVE